MRTFRGYEVLGSEIKQNGCFRITKYWLKGRIYEFGFKAGTEYIDFGWSGGPETIVVDTKIVPCVSFTIGGK